MLSSGWTAYKNGMMSPVIRDAHKLKTKYERGYLTLLSLVLPPIRDSDLRENYERKNALATHTRAD